MTRDAIAVEAAATVDLPFSAAVRSGDLLFVSGVVGHDAATGELVGDDVRAQAEQIFTNLGAVLRAAGRSLGDVVRVGVYLADMADYAAMNEVYRRHFRPPYPARTAVAVAGLPLGARIELDAVVG